MDSGILLLLLFLALSVLDSVARARRRRQGTSPSQEQDDEALPREETGSRSREGAGSERPEGRGGKGDEAENPEWSLDKILGLEDIIGLKVPDDSKEEDSTEEYARLPGRGGPESDSETTQAGPELSGAEDWPASAPAGAEGAARLPERDPSSHAQDTRRAPKSPETRPALVTRKPVPLPDSPLSRRRPAAAQAAPPAPGSQDRARVHARRRLFADGSPDDLRRAFVLKEVLGQPASERERLGR